MKRKGTLVRKVNPTDRCIAEDAISYIVLAEQDITEFWDRLRTIVIEKSGRLDNTDIEALVRIVHNQEIANAMGKRGWWLFSRRYYERSE